MTIKQLIAWGSTELQKAGIEEFKNDAKILLLFLLNIDSHNLLLCYNNLLDQEQINKYKNLIEKRKTKKPLQYIVGSWEFYGLLFELSPDTLIPRADTEILVDKVLEKIKIKDNIKVLDICSGSGCIGIALLKNTNNSTAVLLDKVQGANYVATKNIRLNKVEDRANVLTADVFNINFDDNKFDVIVSNPPYIKTKDMENMDKSVIDYEPIIALDGGEDGLDFYKHIIINHKNALKSGGIMAFEIGDGINSETKMSEETKKLFLENGFKNIEITLDLNKIERVITAEKI